MEERNNQAFVKDSLRKLQIEINYKSIICKEKKESKVSQKENSIEVQQQPKQQQQQQQADPPATTSTAPETPALEEHIGKLVEHHNI